MAAGLIWSSFCLTVVATLSESCSRDQNVSCRYQEKLWDPRHQTSSMVEMAVWMRNEIATRSADQLICAFCCLLLLLPSLALHFPNPAAQGWLDGKLTVMLMVVHLVEWLNRGSHVHVRSAWDCRFVQFVRWLMPDVRAASMHFQFQARALCQSRSRFPAASSGAAPLHLLTPSISTGPTNNPMKSRSRDSFGFAECHAVFTLKLSDL